MTVPIILASGSQIRAAILKNAGIAFEIIRPDTDEDDIKSDWVGPLDGLAAKLADEKALDVARHNNGLVIGSDQILEFDGTGFDKPKSIDEARTRLMLLAGKTHHLINATTLCRDGEIVWRNLERPALKMRDLTEREVDDYLAAADPSILSSVGAYQIERLGARMFTAIDGDYFAVLGLSLFPLLSALREHGGLSF